MGKFSNSFIKGIGFGLGIKVSSELFRGLKNINPNSRLFGMSTRAQRYSIFLWFLMLFPIGFFFGKVTIFFWFFLGIFPSMIVVKLLYRKNIENR